MTEPVNTELLETFPIDLAQAVVAELRAANVAAELEVRGDEAAVLVPQGLRSSAWATLATRMDAVAARAGGPGRAAHEVPAATVSWHPETDEDDTFRPLVTERLRSFWVIGLLLAPMLVLSLTRVQVPVAVAIAVVVGGAALLLALRERSQRKDDPPAY